MKNLVVVVLLFLPLLASAFPKVLESGVYKGLGPTDESAVQLGEVQIDVITNRIATIRYATGLKVEESHIDMSQLVELTPAESLELGLRNVVAYRPVKGGYPVIVLNHALPRGVLAKFPAMAWVALGKIFGSPAVTIYTGGLGDMVMPLILYSPKQVVDGRFDKAVAKIEKEIGKKGIIPRVGFNGRAFSNDLCSYLLATQGNLDSDKTDL